MSFFNLMLDEADRTVAGAMRCDMAQQQRGLLDLARACIAEAKDHAAVESQDTRGGVQRRRAP